MTKKKWLGVLYNLLVPGLGNAYAGKLKKGIVIYLLFFIIVFSPRFVAYNFSLFVVSLISITAYYVYLVVSGYLDVTKDRLFEPAKYDKGYVYVLVIVAHVVLVNIIFLPIRNMAAPVNFAVIPTPAMEPALRIGDRLVFGKTESIKRNDVVVFWFPDDVKTMYVKRAIGIPGDSLQIKRSDIFINGVQQPELHLKYKYAVSTNGAAINPRVLVKHNLTQNDYRQTSPGSYHFFLTEEHANKLRELKAFGDVQRVILEEGDGESMIYPQSGNVDWNSDFYGPVYIPRKDDKIELTSENINLYMKCIEFENESVERSSSGLMINGEVTTMYRFKQNYYFMMGDNRHNSYDSRYWGFLPESLVIGKAFYLYWSRTKERIGDEIM